MIKAYALNCSMNETEESLSENKIDERKENRNKGMKRHLEVCKLWHVSYSPRNPVAKRKNTI